MSFGLYAINMSDTVVNDSNFGTAALSVLEDAFRDFLLHDPVSSFTDESWAYEGAEY